MCVCARSWWATRACWCGASWSSRSGSSSTDRRSVLTSSLCLRMCLGIISPPPLRPLPAQSHFALLSAERLDAEAVGAADTGALPNESRCERARTHTRCAHGMPPAARAWLVCSACAARTTALPAALVRGPRVPSTARARRPPLRPRRGACRSARPTTRPTSRRSWAAPRARCRRPCSWRRPCWRPPAQTAAARPAAAHPPPQQPRAPRWAAAPAEPVVAATRSWRCGEPPVPAAAWPARAARLRRQWWAAWIRPSAVRPSSRRAAPAPLPPSCRRFRLAVYLCLPSVDLPVHLSVV